MSSPEVSRHSPRPPGIWPIAKRLLTIAFFILVLVMLVVLAKKLDWQEILQTLRAYPASTLAWAALACAASYLVYSGFDVLGRRYTGHQLPLRQIMPVTFVCYAFNLNLGSWVGGIAFRYRLYSRLGLENAEITKILSLSLVTNWLGYMLLAGGLFVSRQVELPASWKLGTLGLQALGALLLAIALGYLVLCKVAKKRTWHLRGHAFTLPSFRLASLQALLGATNWTLMALIVYLLLGQRVGFPLVLGALLISSIAGVITHIPAGLGVLETVFVTLLQDEISKGSLLAALIGYRIIYFLVPLLIATVLYLTLEAKAKQLKQRNTEKTQRPDENQHPATGHNSPG
ncbi:MAG: lysylphosphatidylglycerol synthase domain-containing protein [Pseudomonas sp.]|uniref:lysylphosphatidylglycerol synthase domain-containing protein n=1 Tax=Pseudomonas sp. TaxID=306 RepID=UPI00339B4B9E